MNVSKSGIGFSTGVKGMRYSVGPRGTYVGLVPNLVEKFGDPLQD